MDFVWVLHEREGPLSWNTFELKRKWLMKYDFSSYDVSARIQISVLYC